MKKQPLFRVMILASLVAAAAFTGCSEAKTEAGNNIPVPPITVEEPPLGDRIPMIMVDGTLYYDTGRESTLQHTCGTMDGEVTSKVDQSQVPTEDNQSNFGTGFGYQYGAEGTIEVYMNEKWFVFESREDTAGEAAGSQKKLPDL